MKKNLKNKPITNERVNEVLIWAQSQNIDINENYINKLLIWAQSEGIDIYYDDEVQDLFLCAQAQRTNIDVRDSLDWLSYVYWCEISHDTFLTRDHKKIRNHKSLQMSDEHIDLMLKTVKDMEDAVDDNFIDADFYADVHKAIMLCRACGCTITEICRMRGRHIREYDGLVYLEVAFEEDDYLCVPEYSDYLLKLKEQYKDDYVLESIRFTCRNLVTEISNYIYGLMRKLGIDEIYKIRSIYPIRKNYLQKLIDWDAADKAKEAEDRKYNLEKCPNGEEDYSDIFCEIN